MRLRLVFIGILLLAGALYGDRYGVPGFLRGATEGLFKQPENALPGLSAPARGKSEYGENRVFDEADLKIPLFTSN
ncbi:MAG: hypothetical protein HKN14_05735 [Marinicaulis sp.]|nr:hypothetical protein [Marinicaulis sp.]